MNPTSRSTQSNILPGGCDQTPSPMGNQTTDFTPKTWGGFGVTLGKAAFDSVVSTGIQSAAKGAFHILGQAGNSFGNTSLNDHISGGGIE